MRRVEASRQSEEDFQRIKEHLQHELARVDLWLKYAQSPEDGTIREQLQQSEQQSQSLQSQSDSETPLQRLYRICDLDRQTADLLLFCMAPSLDIRFAARLAELSGNGTPDVTPALLAEVFGETLAWSEFCFGSHPLFDMGLLYADASPAYGHSQIHRPIRATRRLIAYIHAGRTVPEPARDFLTNESSESVQPGVLHVGLQATMDHLAANVSGTDESLLFYFHGADGSGKLKAARQLCAQANRPLFSLDLNRLPLDARGDRSAFKAVLREIKLAEAAVIISDWHAIEQRPTHLDFALRELCEAAQMVILTSEEPFRLSRKRFPLIEVSFEDIGYAERSQAWNTHLNGAARANPEIDVNRLSGLYRFNEGQIQSVVERSKLRRKMLSGDEAISEAELVAGCREESSQKLAELAQRVPTRHSWDFLIMQEAQKDQLREICNHIRFKARVYEDWGYDKRVAAPGLHALFTGPPGTGKTLAASVMGNELGLDVYKVDLSTVVSKYIGETEKNLSKIFREAESSNAILFFDEADSLFGKRSAVNDAHDRYANIQVGYLLQRMEEFPGMTILATNLTENIDEAFARRLHFSVDFPLPDAEERERIWRVSFPEQAPLSEDVDFAVLGERIKVPGGNIRNIALHAAFFAAAEDSKITLEHIRRAATREYEKEGRSLSS